MLFSFFSAVAIGLLIPVTIHTLVIPFTLGLFYRRDNH